MRALKLRILALASVALLAIPTPTAAGTIVTTELDVTGGLVTLGNTVGVTFGQTFQTPNDVDRVLELFRVNLRTDNPGLFVARLAEWDPIENHPIGPVLFTSPVGVTPTAPDPVYLTFLLPGGVLLTPETDYAFFLSIASTAGGPTMFTTGNPYADGGRFVTLTSDLATVLSNPATATTQADQAFTAQFGPARASEVPEPASLLILATGVASVAAFRRLSGGRK